MTSEDIDPVRNPCFYKAGESAHLLFRDTFVIVHLGTQEQTVKQVNIQKIRIS